VLEVDFLQFVWEKPVLTFYRERFGNPEKDAFVAVKAKKFVVSSNEVDTNFSCTLEDFFPIIGQMDYILSQQGKADSYVLCWFDDTVNDFRKSFRRLTGVTFQEDINCKTNEKGKITYNALFKAKHGKLK